MKALMRCDKQEELTTLETKDGKQQAELCSQCVEIVIKGNTVWHVKQEEESE
jgi:hypothetical protein